MEIHRGRLLSSFIIVGVPEIFIWSAYLPYALGDHIATSEGKDSMGYGFNSLRDVIAIEPFDSPFIEKGLTHVFGEIAGSDPRLILILASLGKVNRRSGLLGSEAQIDPVRITNRTKDIQFRNIESDL